MIRHHILSNIVDVDKMLSDVTTLTSPDVLLLSHDEIVVAASAELQKSLDSVHQLQFVSYCTTFFTLIVINISLHIKLLENIPYDVQKINAWYAF